ncbi:probable NAD kinase (polyphosphate/ATP) [Halobacterium hubeiense]|uniref:NAD kinase n=1 Tax=Halobacterium hubeiense TaxID=1407499 RepID=A0A0U5CZZ3_9EURY|nr:NAD(+)/NADH kinase [Halobacterium hubeiense]CQH60527.1 probable NAD kinase (polyphosphate/ATP) [Halobacterium hubeiense]
MRVGIVAQRGNSRAAYLAADVREMLAGEDAEVWLDTATADALDGDGHEVAEFDACDLVVSIGGDGTFLFAARGARSTPVLGVNLGEVGFLNAVAPEDAVAAVRREVERYRETDEVRHREVPRAAASGEREWSLTPALNEVVIQGDQRGHGRGIDLEVRVDGSLFEATHADGVLIATPTGSTAYNLSEGGPLVQPGVDAFVVTGMCAEEAMPPLLTPVGGEVTVRVDGPEYAVVSSDGSNRQRVQTPEVITVEAADEPARVAGPDSDFFQALNKLK